jgi:hypothetical protein
MRDQLPSFGARAAKSHAVHHVIQAALQQSQQVLARGAPAAGGFLVIIDKLPLEHRIDAPQFLFLT